MVSDLVNSDSHVCTMCLFQHLNAQGKYIVLSVSVYQVTVCLLLYFMLISLRARNILPDRHNCKKSIIKCCSTQIISSSQQYQKRLD